MLSSRVIVVCLAFLMCSIVLADSESAFFIPRAFYKIDSEGRQSPLAFIGSENQQKIAHRLKRSADGVFTSSSSSSSSSTNGGPVYFQQTSSQSAGPNNFGLVPQSPLFQPQNRPFNLFPSGFPFQNNNFPNNVPGNNFVAPNNNNNFAASSTSNLASSGGNVVAANNLFKANPEASLGLDQRFDDSPSRPVVTNGNGVFTSTSGVILPNGQVQYSTQNGSF